MKGENLKDRFMNFAIRVMNMVAAMPVDNISEYLSEQVICSVGKAGGSYWGACRASSKEDFIESLKTTEMKLDLILYWLELIRECKIFPPDRLAPLIKENEELMAIIGKSISAKRSTRVSEAKKKKMPSMRMTNDK